MLLTIMSIENEQQRDLVLVLYQLYNKALLLYANSILFDPAEAEDVVHAVFAKLIARPEPLKYETAQENKAYLMVMARNLALNRLRAKRKEAPYGNEAEMEPASSKDGVEEQIILSESVTVAQSLIRELPEIYQDVVWLRYVKGLSDAEISQIVDISVVNVRVRIHRGLKLARAAARKGEFWDE